MAHPCANIGHARVHESLTTYRHIDTSYMYIGVRGSNSGKHASRSFNERIEGSVTFLSFVLRVVVASLGATSPRGTSLACDRIVFSDETTPRHVTFSPMRDIYAISHDGVETELRVQCVTETSFPCVRIGKIHRIFSSVSSMHSDSEFVY